ncbi:MAG: hypothetical protein M3312_03805 [Actinomycetota bacterium]|nr:hypothetical protein [Actinomycetota bacterium]
MVGSRRVGREKGDAVLCALTVRKLKPGTYDQFRRAWDPGPELWVEGWQRAYHVRNTRDPNEVISFGFFEGTLEELERRTADVDPDGSKSEERQRRLAECVESIGADSIYEVIEEVRPPTR